MVVAIQSVPDPEQAEAQTQALTLPDEARELAIRNDDDYQKAALFLRERCKAVMDEISAAFDPIIKKNHEAHKEALAQKKKAAAPVLEAEGIVKGLIAAYRRKMEEKRRQEEAEARRKAQELAEKEALERAAQLEAEGHAEEAEKVISEPIKPAPFVAPAAAPKAEGISGRKVWKFRVVDASKINAAFMVPDEVKIGQIVRSMKGEAAAIVGDGIEIYYEEAISARGI